MLDTDHEHISHDMPCPRCGHGAHTYLPCSDSCDCPPTMMPGTVLTQEDDRTRVLVV